MKICRPRPQFVFTFDNWFSSTGCAAQQSVRYIIFRLQASYLSATSHTGRESCRVKSLYMKRFWYGTTTNAVEIRLAGHTVYSLVFFYSLFRNACDFKGTVSWDRFQKFWQKFTELGLTKGRGWFLNFLGGSNYFKTQKVYLLRLMPFCVGLTMVLLLNKCYCQALRSDVGKKNNG